jgi:3-oxoacyl-[acyl-carrier-protein] synthase-1
LHGRYGVILASTKGRLNDFVWNPAGDQLREDPLTPLLHSALTACELNPCRSVVVSNACSSGLAAARLAQIWLSQGMRDVLIFAADAVSDFVLKGFETLKLLSTRPPRPFAADRDGFLLGEAAACMWITSSASDALAVLHRVGLDSEGSAVTRPSTSGISLIRAARQVPGVSESPSDLILAHGTGTLINDQTEDLAFTQLFGRPLVTGSKWCVGHTLAASGLVDMILACEMLRQKGVFTLHTTSTVDPAFGANYLTNGSAMPEPPKRVLVSSLGFGGMHASALLEVAT